MGKLEMTKSEREYLDDICWRIDRLACRGDVEKLRLLRSRLAKKVMLSEYSKETVLVFENLIYYITKILIEFEEDIC